MAITTSRKKFNYFSIFINLIFVIYIFVLAIIKFKTGYYLYSIILGVSFMIYVFCFVYFILGIVKANKKIAKDIEKIKNENPYIYFRELPNNYGVGVASVLLNSSIENEKDIVAAVLDLCAKGYLHLEKNIDGTYAITALKLIDSKLLANERYIMENVINGNVDKLNYREWLERCIMDGIELGLFAKSEKKSFGNLMHQKNGENVKPYLPYLFALSILISLFELSLNINNLELIYLLSLAIPCIILNFTVIFIIFLVFINLIPFVRNSLNIASKYGYNSIISGHLKHTENGEKEVHKLYSFSAFIDDFGAFASKNPEEVVLWDYYLGYAQVFGLTDKILKTGYDKIIRNGSFQIDNINAISLKNIKVNLNKN